MFRKEVESVSNNVNEVASYMKSEFKELLGDNISEYELDMVAGLVLEPFRTVPNNRLMIADAVQTMTQLKSNINYLTYKLNDSRREVELPYRVDYNKYFTVLTRSGRPSKAAIDAEINHTYDGMESRKRVLERYQMLIDFLESQKDVVDLAVRNLESKRYEL